MSDAFFEFIVDKVTPSLPEAAAQNATATNAIVSAAVAFARGSYDVVLDGVVRPQILATVRESLSNVVRHAQASAVTVEVSADTEHVVARITDNGVGIGEQRRSSGLRNLTERAQALGGAVRVTDNEPHGTIVELRAPLVDG